MELLFRRVFKLRDSRLFDNGRHHRYDCALHKLLALLGHFLPKWLNIPHM